MSLFKKPIDGIGCALRSIAGRVSEDLSAQWRLNGRIRLLNRWCRHNPKKMFVCFLVTFFSIAVLDFMLFQPTPSNSKHLKFDTSAPTVYEDWKDISNEYGKRNELIQFVNKTIDLRSRMDSLINIPNKSHVDSMQLLQCVNELKSLSTKTNK